MERERETEQLVSRRGSEERGSLVTRGERREETRRELEAAHEATEAHVENKAITREQETRQTRIPTRDKQANRRTQTERQHMQADREARITLSLTFVRLHMVRGKETDGSRGEHLSLPPRGVVFGEDLDHFVCLEAQLIVMLRLERVDRDHTLSCNRDAVC